MQSKLVIKCLRLYYRAQTLLYHGTFGFIMKLNQVYACEFRKKLNTRIGGISSGIQHHWCDRKQRHMYIRALRSHGMVPTKNTQSILIACGVLKIYDLIRGDIHPLEHNTLSVRHCDKIIKFNSNKVHENHPYRELIPTNCL